MLNNILLNKLKMKKVNRKRKEEKLINQNNKIKNL